MNAQQPPVAIGPPTQDGGRRVRVRGEILGVAYRPADVIEFLRRAGLDPDAIQLDDPDLIEWRGGGLEVWTQK